MHSSKQPTNSLPSHKTKSTDMSGIFFVVSLVAVGIVSGEYTVSLELVSFTTDRGQKDNGRCCDFPSADDCDCSFWCIAAYRCDLYFDVCVESGLTQTNETTQCAGGWKKTGVLSPNDNSVRFPNPYSSVGGFQNPLMTKFNETWDVTDSSVTVKFVAWDEDTASSDLVERFTMNFAANSFLTSGVPYSMERIDVEGAIRTRTNFTLTVTDVNGRIGNITSDL